MLLWKYPFMAATKRAAKSSVTALRRQAADELDDEAEPIVRSALDSRAQSNRRAGNCRPRKPARRITNFSSTSRSKTRMTLPCCNPKPRA